MRLAAQQTATSAQYTPAWKQGPGSCDVRRLQLPKLCAVSRSGGSLHAPNSLHAPHLRAAGCDLALRIWGAPGRVAGPGGALGHGGLAS